MYPAIETSKKNIVLLSICLAILLYGLVALVKMAYFSPSADLFTVNAFFYSRLLLWVYLGLIFLIVYKVEKQKFLLWPDKKYSVTFYLLSVISILLIVIITIGVLSKIESHYGWSNSDNLKKMLHLLWENKLLLLFTTLSAAIIEELLFRGYLLPRLQILLKSGSVSVIISATLFALVHISYGNLSQLINPFAIGLIFGIYYYKFKNLKVLIICHFLIDFISILTTH